ncbi:MAG: hypothetical protein LBD92_07695 [Oscillospiraceae bacterium]|jgi:hypothetical protein|nr:hypothetical protein [Oscillospiraceae bacterium]
MKVKTDYISTQFITDAAAEANGDAVYMPITVSYDGRGKPGADTLPASIEREER